jgi:hypothetical protein
VSTVTRASCQDRHLIPDGTYSALIVDAVTDADGTVHVEVTLVAGEHKGDVVRLAGRFPGKDELDLLAMPATLVVSDGQPMLTLDA